MKTLGKLGVIGAGAALLLWLAPSAGAATSSISTTWAGSGTFAQSLCFTGVCPVTYDYDFGALVDLSLGPSPTVTAGIGVEFFALPSPVQVGTYQLSRCLTAVQNNPDLVIVQGPCTVQVSSVNALSFSGSVSIHLPITSASGGYQALVGKTLNVSGSITSVNPGLVGSGDLPVQATMVAHITTS